ncbi:enoyl-CoA hydratase [Candidatus Endobugula sertula]|uniref:Enoyl-CoA hydratase n=1 Tax=Candidatus Endobugula sertula TaxID=62101 RepID=A0A1D2QR82_9GAMM|nr:enoyl-CoA hydratase [Candidatus Endobugula sertula]
MNYQTLRVRFEVSKPDGDEDICFLQLYRPEANNTINDQMVKECIQVIEGCYHRAKIVVIEGLTDVFCFGADFQGMANSLGTSVSSGEQGPERLYNLWHMLTSGPFVSIAHVKGRVNAGGVGFVTACDLAVADSRAYFSLSELLFGLMPACVFPFLMRRMGFQRAHVMTLMTHPISAKQAQDFGLIDNCSENSETQMHQYLQRLCRLNKVAIQRYKNYISTLDDSLLTAKPYALAANREVFTEPENLKKIARYVNCGKFPWED